MAWTTLENPTASFNSSCKKDSDISKTQIEILLQLHLQTARCPQFASNRPRTDHEGNVNIWKTQKVKAGCCSQNFHFTCSSSSLSSRMSHRLLSWAAPSSHSALCSLPSPEIGKQTVRSVDKDKESPSPPASLLLGQGGRESLGTVQVQQQTKHTDGITGVLATKQNTATYRLLQGRETSPQPQQQQLQSLHCQQFMISNSAQQLWHCKQLTRYWN